MATETFQEKLARIRAARTGGASNLVPQQDLAQLPSKADEASPVELSPIEMIPGFNYAEFNRILEIFKTQLESNAPGIANYLRDIHANLNQYPELCHLLNDEQLNLIVSGYFSYTDTKMADVVVKSKKGKVTLDEAAKLFG